MIFIKSVFFCIAMLTTLLSYSQSIESLSVATQPVHENTETENKKSYYPNIDTLTKKQEENTNPAILKTLGGLILTLLTILILSYLAKKVGIQGINKNSDMHIISSVSLGQKEKAVLVKVHNQTLLLGVAQGGVSLIKDINTLTIKQPSDANKIQEKDSVNNDDAFKDILNKHKKPYKNAKNIIDISKYLKRIISRD